MSSDLRKCVALAPDASRGDSYYNYGFQGRFVDQTQTKWVRFWADWPSLQPRAPTSSDPGWDEGRWDQLNHQILLANQAANNAGVGVILTAYRTPTWAIPPTMTDGTLLLNQYYPQYRGTSSPWAAFIKRLLLQYTLTNPGRPASIHFLELMNEPNYQTRPRQGRTQAIADMILTALAVKKSIGLESNWPALLAPGTSDTDARSTDPDALPEHYADFTNDLLDKLGTFRGNPWFGWSHHNYRDVERDSGATSTFQVTTPYGPMDTTNRAHALQQLLKTRGWFGWGQATASAQPRLLLTEGGARLDVVRANFPSDADTPAGVRSKQRWLMERNAARMRSDTGEGTGIAMLSWFLFTSAAGFDCGLRDPYVYNLQKEII
jgi:hypothetical protein